MIHIFWRLFDDDEGSGPAGICDCGGCCGGGDIHCGTGWDDMLLLAGGCAAGNQLVGSLCSNDGIDVAGACHGWGLL